MKTALKPGMTLQGRYKILSLIGKGGMGFVYKVVGLRLNKELAMKEMYDHFVDPTDREKIVKQFQNEAETMAKLDHPGIPRILDTFEENGRNYLVMEFVEGSTLEQVVMDNPQYLLEDQVLNWIDQILDIMDYLHNRPDPVIIRDLKPANIMLENTGKIKIIDFGIAKIFDPRDGTVTAIKGSGSAGFAPPEQYGSGGTDHRSDIYALGVTLYYLLTKIIIPDSVDRILKGGEILPPSYYNPIVSEATDSLILKMIELKPDDRFQNVAEIRDFMNNSALNPQIIPDPVKPSASSLPKTAVRLENQGVIEDWKKIQSQPSLSQKKDNSTNRILKPDSPALMPPTGRVSSNPSTGKISSNPPANSTISQPQEQEREYHFISEAMLKNKSDEESVHRKKQQIPSFIITGVFIGVIVFIIFLLSVPMIFRHKNQNSNDTAIEETIKPSPTPKIVKLIEKHKEISGTITRIEKAEGFVRIRLKSTSGNITLKMKKAQVPQKVLVGAEIKAEYKISTEGDSKPPWPVVSMIVLKSAPPPEPIYNPASQNISQPVYNQTQTYRPAQNYRPPPQEYRPARTYAPQQTYNSPPSSGGGKSQGGSLTHDRPKF